MRTTGVDTLVTRMLNDSTIRSINRLVGPRRWLHLTRRHKPDRRQSRVEFVVTVGAPNARARNALKQKRTEIVTSYPEKRR